MRSTVWTLGVMLLLVVGINLLVLIPLHSSDDTSVPVLAPGLFGLMLGQLAILTLGVLVITSEYGTGMIRTTFTACPQRSRVLTAKAIVFFAAVVRDDHRGVRGDRAWSATRSSAAGGSPRTGPSPAS